MNNANKRNLLVGAVIVGGILLCLCRANKKENSCGSCSRR